MGLISLIKKWPHVSQYDKGQNPSGKKNRKDRVAVGGWVGGRRKYKAKHRSRQSAERNSHSQ